MEQNVYIDVLVVLNLFINFLLLSAVSKLFRCEAKRYRLVLGALTGAVFSLLIYFELHMLLSPALKLLFSAVMIAVSFGFPPWRRFLKLCAALFAVSFLFAGIMTAVWVLIAPPGMALNNGIVYFDFSPLLFVLLTVICYLALSLVNRVFKRSAPAELLETVELTVCGKSAVLTALIDTGNQLTEMFSGFPVVVTEFGILSGMMTTELNLLFISVYGGKTPKISDSRFRVIPFDAVSGFGVLPAVRADCVKIRNKRITEVYVAACNKNVSNGDYRAIAGLRLYDRNE